MNPRRHSNRTRDIHSLSILTGNFASEKALDASPDDKSFAVLVS